MSKLNIWDWIAFILLIIGGLNWGLVAFGYDAVSAIFGEMSTLSVIIYGLIGLSAIYMLVFMRKYARK